MSWICDNCGLENFEASFGICKRCSSIHNCNAETETLSSDKISWKPIGNCNNAGPSHYYIKSINRNRLILGLSLGYALVTIIGFMASWSALIYMLHKSEFGNNAGTYVVCTCVALFSYSCYGSFKPKILDKDVGFYWHAWGIPSVATKGKVIELDKICALQLLSFTKTEQDSAQTWQIYQLIFVMTDKSRVPFLEHGNFTQITEQAKLVAEFLEVPVWKKIFIKT